MTQAALTRLTRAYLRLATPIAISILLIGAIRLAVMIGEAARLPGAIGIDYTTAMDAAHRWLSGSSPYLARQLSGPYELIGANAADSGEMLYPPAVLPIYAAFTVAPALLWWAIPAGLSATGLWRARPARWTWPILALCLVVGQSIPLIIAGNPTIWVIAAALWSPALGWPGPLILLKPSLAPLALLGIRHRAWWIAAGILGVACIPFGSLWAEWVHSILDMRTSSPAGALYSLQQLPILLIPLLAAVHIGTGSRHLAASADAAQTFNVTTSGEAVGRS